VNSEDTKIKIKGKILELAKDLGKNRGSFADDEEIPASGILDSASIMMLILWYENEFGVSTDNEDLTLDNFGTVNLMADYLTRHR
jgi:D-alanine--poly(phosphoribitol) ligase subunit 2